MYAPVSRQIDTPFQQACPQASLSTGTAGPACLHPAHHRQASLAQAATAHPADFGNPVMHGASLAGSSTALALLVLLLLVTALAIALLSNGRRPALRRQRDAASRSRVNNGAGVVEPFVLLARNRE